MKGMGNELFKRRGTAKACRRRGASRWLPGTRRLTPHRHQQREGEEEEEGSRRIAQTTMSLFLIMQSVCGSSLILFYFFFALTPQTGMYFYTFSPIIASHSSPIAIKSLFVECHLSLNETWRETQHCRHKCTGVAVVSHHVNNARCVQFVWNEPPNASPHFTGPLLVRFGLQQVKCYCIPTNTFATIIIITIKTLPINVHSVLKEASRIEIKNAINNDGGCKWMFGGPNFGVQHFCHFQTRQNKPGAWLRGSHASSPDPLHSPTVSTAHDSTEELRRVRVT